MFAYIRQGGKAALSQIKAAGQEKRHARCPPDRQLEAETFDQPAEREFAK